MLVLLTLAVAGCDRAVPPAPPTACTDVGLVPGVVFDLSAFKPTGTPTVTACVLQRCKVVQPGMADIVEDSALGPEPVSVTLSVDGLLRGSATVTPHKEQPNGPACGPTGYVGSVRATADGQLTS